MAQNVNTEEAAVMETLRKRADQLAAMGQSIGDQHPSVWVNYLPEALKAVGEALQSVHAILAARPEGNSTI
jgi:hypothetical protein